MATREEGIQKINAELEKLTDEQLDQIAGGNTIETSRDSHFLYDHGLMDTWYGDYKVGWQWLSVSPKIDAGWSKAGITCVTKPSKSNQYFVGGKEITRDEAIDIVKSKYPRIHYTY